MAIFFIVCLVLLRPWLTRSLKIGGCLVTLHHSDPIETSNTEPHVPSVLMITLRQFEAQTLSTLYTGNTETPQLFLVQVLHCKIASQCYLPQSDPYVSVLPV